MDTYTEPSITQWCCVDCLMYLANGEFDPDWNEDQINEFLANIERNQGDSLITLGMMAEEHSCTEPRIQYKTGNGFVTLADIPSRFTFRNGRRLFPHLFMRFPVVCDSGFIKGFFKESSAWKWIDAGNRGETMSAVGGECDCEHRDFTWSACDLCGSNLGGSRDAFTFWFKKESE